MRLPAFGFRMGGWWDRDIVVCENMGGWGDGMFMVGGWWFWMGKLVGELFFIRVYFVGI